MLLSRFQSIEVGSSLCDFTFNTEFNLKYRNDPRRDTELSYTELTERYTRTGWLEEQSLCYEQQTVTQLRSILTFHGLCYSFNYDHNIFDKSTWARSFYYFRFRKFYISVHPSNGGTEKKSKWTAQIRVPSFLRKDCKSTWQINGEPKSAEKDSTATSCKREPIFQTQTLLSMLNLGTCIMFWSLTLWLQTKAWESLAHSSKSRSLIKRFKFKL